MMKNIRNLFNDLVKSFSVKTQLQRELSEFLKVEITDLEIRQDESQTEIERFSVFDENEETEVVTIKNVIIKKWVVTYFIGNFRHDLNKNLYPEFYKILLKFKK
jgi:hypothetical protein